MSFRPLKAVPEVDWKMAPIANSQTLAVGDAIIPAGTTHAAAVTGAAGSSGSVLGVIIGIIGNNGKILEVNSYAAAADNETNAKIQAVYIPSYIPLEYEADLSAAAGTTTNSNLMQMFNMSGSVNGKLDETSTGVFSTAKQFFSYGVTSYSTTKVIGHWVKTV